MKKFIISISIVVIVVGYLVYTAIISSGNEVVTVSRLVEEKKSRSNIRLGAKVTEGEINFTTSPLQLKFFAEDIKKDDASNKSRIPVSYSGAKPDTLKLGRDVLLEGSFDGETFLAKNLMTQCPSKYEVPEASKK